MAMAVQAQYKSQQVHYLVKCLQACISVWMWQGTSNSEPNNSTLRSGRLPDTIAESHSISNGWKHSGETITHILVTITRQCGEIPQDTYGTSESAGPTTVRKLGNRLTRRPCKGDEFEILIFEAKRQNAGICRSRQKLFATWTFISIGKRVTQEWKFAFRLRGDSILLFKGPKKTLEIYDFQSSESYQGDIHSSSFFLFSTLAVPERLWQRRSHSLQQGSVVTPCPAVGPSVPFFVHFFLWSIDGGRHSFKCFHVPSICWVPATMVL